MLHTTRKDHLIECFYQIWLFSNADLGKATDQPEHHRQRHLGRDQAGRLHELVPSGAEMRVDRL